MLVAKCVMPKSDNSISEINRFQIIATVRAVLNHDMTFRSD